MIISQENFLKNPSKYKDAVILTAEEYANYENYKLQSSIQRGLADIAAGRVLTHEEVFSKLRKKAEGLVENEKL